MGCFTSMPAGLIKSCGSNFDKVKNIYLLAVGTEFASKEEAVAQGKWIQLIRESGTAWGGKVANSYEVTTDDANVITTDSGRKIETNKPIPSASFMMNTNFCDSQMLLNTVDGGQYEIVMELLDGRLYFEKIAGGKKRGFLATVNIKTKGVFQSADVANNIPMNVYFDNYEMFLNAELIKPTWNLASTILEYSPVGVEMSELVAYTNASGDVTVDLIKRCGTPIVGATTADFAIIATNKLSTPAVTTVVDNGNGSHTLTLDKDVVPASLDIGDFMTLQYKKKTAAIIDEISNEFTVNVIE